MPTVFDFASDGPGIECWYDLALATIVIIAMTSVPLPVVSPYRQIKGELPIFFSFFLVSGETKSIMTRIRLTVMILQIRTAES
jgi:hypothetical protein